jgi:ABC-type branched-subunit amino acid transport system permease subunit
MIQRRVKQFVDSLREGMVTGFVAGMVNVFLILLGIPINLETIALFSLLLVTFIFGIRLARRVREYGPVHLLKNAVAMGATAAFIVFLLMSLINRWQARGIDVKEYFDAVNAETMTVLSGVPSAELHADPERDPLTGEYPEGADLRTNPMRLTFDSDTGLRVLKVNVVIGGFYGFMLLLLIASLLGAVITWAALHADIGEHRKQLTARLSGNPLSHWGVLLLPLVFFALLWLTEGQGSNDPILSVSSSREIQLLIGFGIILWGLVALRSMQPNDWGLAYPVRLGICVGMIALLLALGIWRIVDNKAYFVAFSSDTGDSRTLSIVLALGLGVLAAVQNAVALRTPGRFEIQFAGTQALLALLLMPLYLDQYQNQVMTLVGINILLGVGLNIVVGYAGLLDLGYVAFFALGAYSYAFLSSKQSELGQDDKPIGLKFEGNTEMVVQLAGWMVITVIVTLVVVYIGIRLWRRNGGGQRLAESSRVLVNFPALPTRNITTLLTIAAILISALVASILDSSGLYQSAFEKASPFLIGVIVGTIIAGLSGIALGIPVLRLRGDYLAIVTLGFGEIIRLLFTNLRDYTGGPQGILEIPRPLPDGVSGAVTYLWMVYLVFLGAGLVAFVSIRLKQSRMGRAWSAMRSDEDIAQSMGINLVQSKLTAFAIGAAFAGIGGVLFAARQRNIYPNDFKLDVSIEVLSLVIIGGMGSIPGVVMGAIALIGVPEVLRELSTYRILVFGALLVTMVIIRPAGLLPAPAALLQDRARALVAKQPPYRQEEGGEL